MKKSTVTMDTLLRFLDGAQGKAAAFITGQQGDWFASRAESGLARWRSDYCRLASVVRQRAQFLEDDDVVVRAGLIAAALDATEFPALTLTGVAPAVNGRWHEEVWASPRAGAILGRREGKEINMGMADYRLRVQPTCVSLDTTGFEERLGILGCPSSDGTPDNEEQINADFAAWVMATDPSACRSAEGKKWTVGAEGDAEEIFFICLPEIASASAAIKRLRRLEGAFPSRVYVCLADPEEAQTFQRQGFGTLTFPSGELHGRPLVSSDRFREDASEAGWSPRWSRMERLAY